MEIEMEEEVRRIPTEADFLMAYSVVPGNVVVFLLECRMLTPLCHPLPTHTHTHKTK